MDRNSLAVLSVSSGVWSLSARRAWIEIFDVARLPEPATVALRKESVDRNVYLASQTFDIDKSLSARRAWIEIFLLFCNFFALWSLSARRAWIEIGLALGWSL